MKKSMTKVSVLVMALSISVMMSSCLEEDLVTSTNDVTVSDPRITLWSDSGDQYPNLSARIYISSYTAFTDFEFSTNDGAWWQTGSVLDLDTSMTILARGIRDGFSDSRQSSLRVSFFKDLLNLEGSYGYSPGQGYVLAHPTAIHYLNGKVYVDDRISNQIVVFDTNGNYLTSWGSLGSGNGQMSGSFDMTIAHGEIYVADTANHRVQVFDLNGNFKRKFGVYGTGTLEFNNVYGIEVYQDKIYVADGNHRVSIYTTNGVYLKNFGTSGTGNGQFNNPMGLAVDGEFIYVADYGNSRVQVFDINGIYQYQFGSNGTGDQQFQNPTDVFAHNGRLYISDFYNHRLKITTQDGQLIDKVGTYSHIDSLNRPFGAYVRDHEIYFVERDGKKFHKLSW